MQFYLYLMAEYCPTCADKYGFEKERDVILCKGCSKHFDRVEKE
jgi:hypothetical protein